MPGERRRAGRAADDIRDAIEAAGGAIPFSTFMDMALYGRHGFYTSGNLGDPGDRSDQGSGGSAGRRGDFLTSPEVGPLFGAVLARFLDAEWTRLARPDPFSVVDAGAGPGTLARTVLAARPACAGVLRYIAVEVSPAQRARHPADVESRADLPAGPIDGVVVANELLDNLPFRLAIHDGAWREAYVTTAADGSFAEVLSAPFDPRPAVLPAVAPHGARAPLQDVAVTWLDRARSLVGRGSVVVIDYARASTAELAAMPWRSWLRTYRGHERGSHYLADPGQQDITVDVALDQLREPDALRSQAQFLQRHGISELVDEGRRAWTAAAPRPDLQALTMRSRVAESEALLDSTGLGAFTVAEWRF
jgi:SAM-dependent MidA family methyltransferase